MFRRKNRRRGSEAPAKRSSHGNRRPRRYYLIALLFLTCNLHAVEPVVVCIHGFMRTKRNMGFIKSSFEKDGWTVINWSYPSKEKSILAHAEDLARDLHFITEAYPNRPIYFITRSLGGIIVRQAVNLPGCPKQALLGKAVFLAPPNRGSSFGRYLRRYKSVKKILGHYAGHELMIMKSFEHIGPMPPTMKVMVIAGDLGQSHTVPGKNDGKVAA